MKTDISLQLMSLSLALLLGFTLGAVYDMLRPIRRSSGKTVTAIIDILFALISGTVLFLFAMGAGSGKLGIWELTAAFLGFTAYTYTLSDFLFHVFSKLYVFLHRAAKKAQRIPADFVHGIKKHFKIPMK